MLLAVKRTCFHETCYFSLHSARTSACSIGQKSRTWPTIPSMVDASVYRLRARSLSLNIKYDNLRWVVKKRRYGLVIFDITVFQYFVFWIDETSLFCHFHRKVSLKLVLHLALSACNELMVLGLVFYLWITKFRQMIRVIFVTEFPSLKLLILSFSFLKCRNCYKKYEIMIYV